MKPKTKKFLVYTSGDDKFEIKANFSIDEIGFKRLHKKGIQCEDSHVFIDATPEAARVYIEYAEKNGIEIQQMF